VPLPRLPLAEQLPKAEDVVASAYDFAEKLLSSHRQFTEELLKAAAPLMPGNSNGNSTRQEHGAE
jgi:hypothetical protein